MCSSQDSGAIIQMKKTTTTSQEHQMDTLELDACGFSRGKGSCRRRRCFLSSSLSRTSGLSLFGVRSLVGFPSLLDLLGLTKRRGALSFATKQKHIICVKNITYTIKTHCPLQTASFAPSYSVQLFCHF